MIKVHRCSLQRKCKLKQTKAVITIVNSTWLCRVYSDPKGTTKNLDRQYSTPIFNVAVQGLFRS